ncbi:MAG: 50S ribosomal protein L10 [Candidatus Kapabacteria bacterium]|nr:50S ribosomal protein L10 [Candidatus Kapabacteria bacterium]
MVTQEKKRQIVAELVEKFRKAQGFYLVDFMGMNVESAVVFRRDLKKSSMELKVAKNTLIKRALSEIGSFNIPEAKYKGATGVIFGYDDPVAPAKVIKDQFEKNNIPSLKAAVIEGVYYDGSQLKQLASLPSKPQLIAGILGSLTSPVSGIVGSINAVLRDVAYLVEEVAKKKAS